MYGVNSNGIIDGQPLKINGTTVAEAPCHLQQTEGGFHTIDAIIEYYKIYNIIYIPM